eukprot:gene4640-5682_t
MSIEGASITDRLHLQLLRSRGAVFLQHSQYKQFFQPLLREYQHYIPVQSALLDLTGKVRWARKNNKQAYGIAERGYRIGQSYLSVEALYCYMGTLLHGLSMVSRVNVAGFMGNGENFTKLEEIVMSKWNTAWKAAANHTQECARYQALLD